MHRCNGFQPVVDGLVIPDTPKHLRDQGLFYHIPEMIGITEDEAFLGMSRGLYSLTLDKFISMLSFIYTTSSHEVLYVS